MSDLYHKPVALYTSSGSFRAVISYTVYLGQLFCPAGLATCYPRRSVLSQLEMEILRRSG